MTNKCNFDLLRSDLERYVKTNGITYRRVAVNCNMYPSTISRLMQGKNIDSDHIAAICKEMDKPLTKYFNEFAAIHADGVDTISKIENVLAHDDKIAEEDKVTLMDLMEIAYRGLVKIQT